MKLDQRDRIGGPPKPQRSLGLVIGLIMIISIFGAGAYFRKEIPAYLNFGQETASGMLGGGGSSDFGPLYQRLGIKPLDVKVAYQKPVLNALTKMKDEFCDKRNIFQLETALRNAGEDRIAAEALFGFAKECKNAEGELYTAADIYFGLGDFDHTVEITDQLIGQNAYNGQVHYLRGQALNAKEKWSDALQSYISAVELFGNPKRINSSVFFELANIYGHLNRYCDAITAVQTWVLVDPTERDTTQTKKMVQDFSTKGRCDTDSAKGTEAFPIPVDGTIRVKAEINGTPGFFIVDTGASFVTITEGFAKRANIETGPADALKMQSANGEVSAALGSAVTVKLGHAFASKVAVVVQAPSLGKGIDGLLGMSFLARFNIALTDKELRLQAKAAQ